ncbi:MAG TPA: hypothetical protein VN420_03690, partial [Candidatus Fimivivens sp.]|nr:hypothetical protein [Candidatus Fimivivens sp.]
TQGTIKVETLSKAILFLAAAIAATTVGALFLAINLLSSNGTGVALGIAFDLLGGALFSGAFSKTRTLLSEESTNATLLAATAVPLLTVGPILVTVYLISFNGIGIVIGIIAAAIGTTLLFTAVSKIKSVA